MWHVQSTPVQCKCWASEYGTLQIGILLLGRLFDRVIQLVSNVRGETVPDIAIWPSAVLYTASTFWPWIQPSLISLSASTEA